ncbi:dephospho-CoA kinase [Alicyclobacillus sp. SO9]|uniref:dephospho-CoA kinase n=1 Tax=Alicyclobacillus sp. SO9 TaxID=2665646 RepID=UPI0018E6DF54|nr:dephospho-CoA kinase [Alicyclobacillus sp. SO9]QQE78010.1 dephospho-CoA kinase [Alicyclobacillus sp. SO9]
MIVGLTGSIATGKSTVTKMLREVGAHVVDADVWARNVVEKGSDGLREIVEMFGPAVLNPDGTLNRQALGSIVFHDKSARESLNAITHPKIRNGMKKETEMFAHKHPDEPVVWDVPLLFEGDTRHLVDVSILVYVDEQTQLQRLMARDGISQEDAMARIASQIPIDRKKSFADYVIDNSNSLENTKEQVQRLWRKLQMKAKESYDSSSSTAEF